MASYDNVTLPGSPAAPSYNAPAVDFSWLSKLPEQRFQGQQRERTLGLQNAFKEGLPQNPDGTIDINSMTQTLAKLGGADAAMPLLNMAIGQQIGNQAGDFVQNPQGGGAPQAVQSRPLPQPTGQQGNASGSLISMIGDAGIPDDKAGPIAATIAARLKIDPNAPITDPSIKDNIQRQLSAAGRTNQPGSSAPITPTPVQTQAVTPDNNLPASFTEAEAKKNMDAASLIRAQAARYAGAGRKDVADKMEKEADAREARAKQIMESLGKRGEITPEMKNAAASGVKNPVEYERDKKAAEEEAKSYAKRYENITKMGSEAAIELPQLEIAKRDMSNPNFYSGPMEGLNLQYKRWLATIDPQNANAAVPQEAFRKAMANSILSQIRSLSGTGAGQIRVAEIRIMEKAAANPENTPAANRRLVEIATRLHQHALAVDGLARDYKGGNLDKGFDNVVRSYEQKHPMFNQKEMQDPRLIAPPVFNNPSDIPKAGLKSGHPFQTPDGRIKYVP